MGQTNRISFIFKILVVLCLFQNSLYSVNSQYYFSRLKKFPNYYFYQKKYLEELITEKQLPKAYKYVINIQNHKRSKLLLGYYYALANKIEKAKMIWREISDKFIYDYSMLTFFYNKYSLNNELNSFLKLIIKKNKTKIVYSKLIHNLFLLGKKHEAFNKLIEMFRVYYREPNNIKRIFIRYIEDEQDLIYLQKKLTILIDDNKFPAALRKAGLKFICEILLKFSKNNLLYNHLKKHHKLIKKEQQFLTRLVYKLNKTGNKSLALKVVQLVKYKEMSYQTKIVYAELILTFKPDVAIRIFKELIRHNLHNRKIITGLSDAYARLHNYTSAIKYLLRMTYFTSTDYIKLGKYYLIESKFKQALKYFSNIKTPEKEFYYSLVFVCSGKLKQALNYLRLSVNKYRYKKITNDALDLLFVLKYLSNNKPKMKIFSKILLYNMMKKYNKTALFYVKLAELNYGFWKEKMLIKAAAFFRLDNQYYKALTYLKKIRNIKGKLTDKAMYMEANILKYNLNNIKKANSVFFDLVAKYPNSVYLYKARKELLK